MGDRANTKEYWDKMWALSKRRVEKYCMQRAWEYIHLSGARSVLDLGCGNGRLLFGVKDLKCFGIDISETAIKRMKKEYGIDGAVLDIYDMWKLTDKYDFIVINHTLEHLYYDENVVRECYHKLNDGGTFFAAVPNDMSGPEETEEHVRKYNKKTLFNLINGMFGNCKIEIIGHHLIGVVTK